MSHTDRPVVGRSALLAWLRKAGGMGPVAAEEIEFLAEASTSHMLQAMRNGETANELREALRNLCDRIDINGGIGVYKGGVPFVMKDARDAIARSEGKTT